jgi:ribosomal protein L2
LALKTFRPTSPGRRGMVKISFEDITKTEPEKSLVVPNEGREDATAGVSLLRATGAVVPSKRRAL